MHTLVQCIHLASRTLWLVHAPTLQNFLPLSEHVYTILPTIRIQHDQLVLYDTIDSNGFRSAKQIENEKNLTRGEFNGYMSPKTKSKVKKYLTTWIESAVMIRNSHLRNQLDKVPYLTFVTLTLPSKQMHSDNEIKRKCLTPFVATLQRKFDVWEYFWRAESQANGNIHFHLIVDSFIDHRKLRSEWNKCINKLKYVDEFAMSWGHHNPNSTDIHSLKNINSPSSYLVKYCCKSDGYRKIDGRIHGCSDDLRKLSPYEDLIDNKMFEFVQKVESDDKAKVFKDDNFKVIKCSVKAMIEKYYPRLERELIKHKVAMAFQLYKIELPPEIQAMTEKKERKKLIQLELFGVNQYGYV